MIRILTMLSLLWLFSSSALGSWSFVTLSDTYSGLEGGMVSRVAQLYTHHNNISFLISTGDFENNQTIDEQFQDRLSSYYPGNGPIPRFEAFGNHHVDAPSDADDIMNVLTPEKIQTQLPGMSNFHMGPHDASVAYAREGSTYSFDYGAAHFVIINQFYATDTGLDGAHEKGGATACIYDTWYDWLVQDLAQNEQPMIFVFGHEPAFPRGNRHCGDSLDEVACTGNDLDWNYPDRPLRDKFWNLLNSHNVVAHFTGHEHAAFSYEASSLMAADDGIYADNRLDADCLSTYNPATRTCGAGTHSAYRSIAGAMPHLAAGKTLFVRSGTYNEVIRPQISGGPGAPITIRNYGDERVTMTHAPYLDATAWGDYDGYRWGIYAWSVAYITIEGLVFDNPGNGWGRFVNSNHIIVRNCQFHDAPTSGDVAGLKFVNSHHNQILNNVIDDGFDNISLIDSNHNLVEGNTVTKADHTLWAIKCGDYNILRKNYFQNEYQKIGEIYDCHDSANADMNHFGILDVNATSHNIVEENIFAGTAVDNGDGPFNGIQLAGQRTIVRRNIFYKSEGTGIGLAYYSQEAEYDLHNRIYQNVFYDNAGGAVITGRSHDPAHFADNIVKNNIMMNNRVMPLGWADHLDSGHQLSHRDMDNFIIDHNCIFTEILPTANSIYVGYDTRVSVAEAQGSFPSLYLDNRVSDPMFEAPTNHNFLLQAGSQMIDAGSFLTTAAGSGTQSNQLVVADATYFSDGFGIGNGDLVQFENQNEAVQVTGIDYTTNTLTLNRTMNWNSGDGVTLKYAGTRPDIGAFEYGSGLTDDQAPTAPGDPSARPISTTQMSLTWTASMDNVGVDNYHIFRCTGNCTPTSIIATTTQTSYTDTSLASSTQYTYQLSAVDTSGNESSRTDTFTGTTHDPDDAGSGGDGTGGGGCFITTSVRNR